MITRTFTPSYDAETREEYEQLVRTGDKRTKHVQVERGRVRVRYGEESPEHDPPADREPQPIQDAAKQRLVRIEPPYGARTQSPASHEAAQTDRTPLDRRLVERIRVGIENYRKEVPGGALGLLVPRDPRRLIAAGVPDRPAYILVRRSKGKLFPAAEAAPQVEDVEQKFALDLSRVLGQFPRVRPEEGLSVGRFGGRTGGTKLVFSVPGTRREAEITGFVLRTPRFEAEVLSEKGIDARYTKHREAIQRSGRPYLPREDDPPFLRKLYTDLLRIIGAAAKRDKTDDVTLIVRYTRMGKPEERSMYVGEHSKAVPEAEGKREIEYRSLKNVPLAQLPEVLARLSKRHHHTKSDKEKHMARRNPNEDRFWFEQYAQGPYGARQAVPAARRNAGEKPKARKAKKGMSQARRAQLARVMSRARELLAAKGCSAAEAMKAAWAAERGAKSNPWYSLESSPLYLPDETQTRSALVRGPYGDLAFTNPKSGLVSGWWYVHYATPEGSTVTKVVQASSEEEAERKGVGGEAMSWDVRPATQKEVSRLHGKPRVSQSAYAEYNPHAPEDFSRAEADLPDMWGPSDFWGGNQAQRGGFSMRGGQFSASGTGGFQPVNRRNPRRDSKGRFLKANGRKSR